VRRREKRDPFEIQLANARGERLDQARARSSMTLPTSEDMSRAGTRAQQFELRGWAQPWNVVAACFGQSEDGFMQ